MPTIIGAKGTAFLLNAWPEWERNRVMPAFATPAKAWAV